MGQAHSARSQNIEFIRSVADVEQVFVFDQKFRVQEFHQLVHHVRGHAVEERRTANGLHDIHLALVFVFGVLGNHICALAQIAAMGAEHLVQEQKDQTAANHGHQQGDKVADFHTAFGNIRMAECFHSRCHQFDGQC